MEGQAIQRTESVTDSFNAIFTATVIRNGESNSIQLYEW